MKDGRPWIDDPCPVCGDRLVEIGGMWGCEADGEGCVEAGCMGEDLECHSWLVEVGCKTCDWEESLANDDPAYTDSCRRDWRDLMQDGDHPGEG